MAAEGGVGGEAAGVGPQSAVAGDAVHGGGVEVAAVDGVELDQAHPQLHVGGGEPVVGQVLLAAQPSLQPAQGVEQHVEGGGPFGRTGAGASGALRGLLDALGAHPLDGLDHGLQAGGVQAGGAARPEPVQVAQDVGGVGADDASGPVVAEHGRERRAGVVVGARLVERAERGVAAAGTVRDRGQEGDGTVGVQAEQAVADGEAQSVGAGGRQVEPVAVRHGVVAAARVPADPAPEDGRGTADGRDGGERSDGHASPRVVGVRRGAPARA